MLLAGGWEGSLTLCFGVWLQEHPDCTEESETGLEPV